MNYNQNQRIATPDPKPNFNYAWKNSNQHQYRPSNYNLPPHPQTNYSTVQPHPQTNYLSVPPRPQTNYPSVPPHPQTSYSSVQPPSFIPLPTENQRLSQRFLPNRLPPPPNVNINRPPPSQINVNKPLPFEPQVNFRQPPPQFHKVPQLNLHQPPPSASTHNPNQFNSQPPSGPIHTFPPHPPHPSYQFPPNTSHKNYNNASPLNPVINSSSHSNSTHIMPDQTKFPAAIFSKHQEHHSVPTDVDGAYPVDIESELEKKRKIGEQRLHCWLQKIGKLKGRCEMKNRNQLTTSTLKINDFVVRLQRSFSILSELASQVNKMDAMILDTDRLNWQRECTIVEQLKAKHTDLRDVVDKGKVKNIQYKLCQVKSKRNRLKRAARIRDLETQEMELERSRKEKEIDDWQDKLQNDMKEGNLKKKRKKEMDQSLSEITRKINDANRLIETMTSLEKLRLIRQDAAMKRGDVELGEPRQSFEQKISDMTRLVHSQLDVYKEEEESIRNAIQSEQEAMTEKERKLQQQQEMEAEQLKEIELGRKLFGDFDEANITDPMFPFQQFYKQAQTSLPAFIQIRHEWDQFLVSPDDSHGSSIPQDWVHPTDPSNNDWAKTLL